MTDFLQVPEIAESQASKYLTHNQAIRKLRILSQVVVIDRNLTAPPGGEADGDCYIPAAVATGAWAGHEGHLAFYSGSAYVFLTPAEGWRAYIADENIFVYWDGAAWASLGGASATSFLALTDTPDSYVGQGLKSVRVNSAADALEFFVEPYIVAAWCGAGKPTASQIMLKHEAVIAFDLPDDLSGSAATLETAATAQTDFDIQKNGASIGTIRFAAAGTDASFLFADPVNFAVGDILKIIAPGSADATAAGLSISLKGTRG